MRLSHTLTNLPRFNLIKSMTCCLALLASGQAFAAIYSHISTSIVDADLTNGTKWINNAMTCGSGTAQ